MADISLCDSFKLKGSKVVGICPLRDSCRRFTTKPTEHHQSWIAAPYIGKQCDHYMKVKQ